MGTVVSITVNAPSLQEGQAAADAAFSRISYLEGFLSDTLSESDVSAVNRSAGTPTKVDPLTLDAVSRALEFSKLSAGSFDVTVGPLLSLWRQCAEQKYLPTEAELQDAQSRVGYQRVTIDAKASTVTIPLGTSVDLGGIAKGYIVDQAVAVLRERVTSALVNAGGDLYALGSKPGGEPWVVGIQDPRKPQDQAAYVETIYVTDKAVATSGSYARYYEIEGKRYSHIINPVTGWPVRQIPSATVIAADATTADALATAASVLSPLDSVRLSSSLKDVEVLLIAREGEKWRMYQSLGIERFIRHPGKP